MKGPRCGCRLCGCSQPHKPARLCACGVGLAPPLLVPPASCSMLLPLHWSCTRCCPFCSQVLFRVALALLKLHEPLLLAQVRCRPAVRQEAAAHGLVLWLFLEGNAVGPLTGYQSSASLKQA